MPKTVETSGAQSLADFQTIVDNTEGILGPLIALGKQGANNTITCDIGPSPAADKRAVLATFQGDMPPEKISHTIICTGDCLVAGQPAKVVAYRSN